MVFRSPYPDVVVPEVALTPFVLRRALELGDKPVPRKLVITSKTVGQSPQFSIEIKNWKTDLSFGPDTVTFSPPSGAQKVEMSKMPHIDEVPESTPLGGAKP